MVLAPELLPRKNNNPHWSEKVPESWNWLKSYGTADQGKNVAVELIKEFEKYRGKTYKDGKGLPTIGYGSRNKEHLKKGYLTENEASKGLKEYLDTNVYPTLQNKPYYSKLNDNQKGALASLIYNIGPTGFNKSTKLQAALTKGNWMGAISQMDHGITDSRNPGLIERRNIEKATFLTGTN